MQSSIPIPGATACFLESQTVDLEAVGDDYDEETETLKAALEIDKLQLADTDDEQYVTLPDTTNHVPENIRPEELYARIKDVSQNVVVTSTLKEYARSETSGLDLANSPFLTHVFQFFLPQPLDNLHEVLYEIRIY
ncbi:hypothetical protein A0H81_11954 [Grifola frondosa]|uniref:Uncharacterized protein n=1 Tax=Grifola frondosa TaxID=5627 RepID=A0A1C7LTM1_GRIFR|nr:hypothetical protein A0H81_11954 [Grifola frondosa]